MWSCSPTRRVMPARRHSTFANSSPHTNTGGSTHSVSPGQVLAIAAACFAKRPRAYLLGMRATRLDDFTERLSAEAHEVLERALAHLVAFAREARGSAS